MKWFVTGATGLLGNNVARLTCGRGDETRVLVRPTADPRPLADLDVTRMEGDLDDEQLLREAIQGVDFVVHSAGYVRIGWQGLEEARRINVDGTVRLARLAMEAGVKFVLVSTVNTLGLGSRDQAADEETPRENQVECSYVVSKREGEDAVLELCQDSLNASIVMPGFMLGPWDWKPSSGQMVLEVAKRFTPAAPSGGCSVCDVRDVAAGTIAAAIRGEPGQRYILAGENITYFDLWKRIAKVTGGQAPWTTLGPVIRGLAGRIADGWGLFRGKERLINSAAIRMGAQFHYYSSERARLQLDYRSRPADEAIQAAWEWFQQHGFA